MNYNVWGKYVRYQHNCVHGGGKSGRPNNIGKWYTVRIGVNNVDNCIHFTVTASFSLSSWAGCYHTCAHTRLTGRCACIYILRFPIGYMLIALVKHRWCTCIRYFAIWYFYTTAKRWRRPIMIQTLDLFVNIWRKLSGVMKALRFISVCVIRDTWVTP